MSLPIVYYILLQQRSGLRGCSREAVTAQGCRLAEGLAGGLARGQVIGAPQISTEATGVSQSSAKQSFKQISGDDMAH